MLFLSSRYNLSYLKMQSFLKILLPFVLLFLFCFCTNLSVMFDNMHFQDIISPFLFIYQSLYLLFPFCTFKHSKFCYFLIVFLVLTSFYNTLKTFLFRTMKKYPLHIKFAFMHVVQITMGKHLAQHLFPGALHHWAHVCIPFQASFMQLIVFNGYAVGQKKIK